MELRQIPLREVLEFNNLAEGRYEFEFPMSVSFGAGGSCELERSTARL